MSIVIHFSLPTASVSMNADIAASITPSDFISPLRESREK
jgi:hypothetical protein